MAALGTFADNARLARLILLEAVSLGPVYQAKRAEVAGRFAALIQRYLDEAVADGSIPPARIDFELDLKKRRGRVCEADARGAQALSRSKAGPRRRVVPPHAEPLDRRVGIRRPVPRPRSDTAPTSRARAYAWAVYKSSGHPGT